MGNSEKLQDDSVRLANQIGSDLPVLVMKIEQIPGYENLDPIKAIEEVVKFLMLIGHNKKRLSPSLMVDLAWHEFVLCTKYYADFCQSQFGRFIHHTPGGDEGVNQQQFKKTIQLYILHFGEPDNQFWGDFAHEEWTDAQCGTCNGN